MIELALAGLIASAGLSSSAPRPEPLVHEVQFRGGPGGECPDGYAFNYSNGRCYRNGYQPPGRYAPPDYRQEYGGGQCPDGFAYNYSNGRCYRNGYQPPGMYAR